MHERAHWAHQAAQLETPLKAVAEPGQVLAIIWGWTGGPRSAEVRVVRQTRKQVVVEHHREQEYRESRYWLATGEPVGHQGLGRLVTVDQAKAKTEAWHLEDVQRKADERLGARRREIQSQKQSQKPAKPSPFWAGGT